jgi:hypothetical protein
MLKLWYKLKLKWYHFDLWLCKDIIDNEITECIHPDFGWLWVPGGDGYRYLEEQYKLGYRKGYVEGQAIQILNPNREK